MAARTDTAPAWVRIEEELAHRIHAGELPAGAQLPPERDLAVFFGVSRMTVRQALGSLAARGTIEREVGRGTFVREAEPIEHDLTRIAGLTEQVERHGLRAGARLLLARRERAPAPVARELDVPLGASALHLRRLRLAGSRPLALEDSWLPAHRFPGLLDRDLRGSLYALMGAHYGLVPDSAVERLSPVAAESATARLLDVPEGAPAMLVERTAYAAGGIPVESARDLHRGDRARFVVRRSERSLLGAGA